jgi:cephalosporin-C deacetylase-like acetyl esterase
MEGFETMEAAAAGIVNPSIEFVLNPPGAGLGGMVRIPGGRYQLRVAAPVELQDYWIDKYEVTNKRFKDFVDQGGYRWREFWKQAFVKDGQILSWEQAMAEFRDATGRSGPSTWELGTYPEGRADFPVGGVSWYEAAAYAEFAGKDLPTIYHWTKAAGFGIFSDILRLSNFSGTGPVQVGTYQGLGPFGTYDMAGNVKEWCWNQTGAKRYILGGAWDDPSYIFLDMIAQSPFDRSVTYGFRCVKYPSPLSEVLTAPIERLLRDYTKEKPASDDVFQIYKSIYSYDRTELKPLIESVEETSELWRKEKISFNAAYANERVTAYLFLPKNATPPYQTVVYFPGSNAFALTSSQDLWTWYLDFVIRSGRAVLHPIYQGTYERRRFPNLSVGDPPNVWRDVVIQCSKDLGRSVDYLETRKEIDGGRLAYYGLSRGAALGPIMTAMEPRLKASVLLAGGFYASKLPPEVDPFHFAPRVRVPVLMVNGRQDFIFPVETSQIPCFHLLGTPEKDKRYVLLEGGHALPRNQVIKEILDWLDRYLGPVKTNNTR